MVAAAGAAMSQTARNGGQVYAASAMLMAVASAAMSQAAIS